MRPPAKNCAITEPHVLLEPPALAPPILSVPGILRALILIFLRGLAVAAGAIYRIKRCTGRLSLFCLSRLSLP
jgi:hypothetical protein